MKELKKLKKKKNWSHLLPLKNHLRKFKRLLTKLKNLMSSWLRQKLEKC